MACWASYLLFLGRSMALVPAELVATGRHPGSSPSRAVTVDYALDFGNSSDAVGSRTEGFTSLVLPLRRRSPIQCAGGAGQGGALRCGGAGRGGAGRAGLFALLPSPSGEFACPLAARQRVLQ